MIMAGGGYVCCSRRQVLVDKDKQSHSNIFVIHLYMYITACYWEGHGVQCVHIHINFYSESCEPPYNTIYPTLLPLLIYHLPLSNNSSCNSRFSSRLEHCSHSAWSTSICHRRCNSSSSRYMASCQSCPYYW